MTRFREEYYATKAYKAEIARRARGPASAVEADRRARWAQYSKKSSQVRKKIYKAAQARLSGF